MEDFDSLCWSSLWNKFSPCHGRRLARVGTHSTVRDAVSALGFGLIEGFVCLADQGVGIGIGCARTARPGNADAAGDVQGSAAGRERGCGQGLADALGLGSGICRVATRQYDQELFTAISADGVVAAPGAL